MNLFHRAPPFLRGETLFPLHKLREKFPEVYKNEVKKYEGRETVLEKFVPPLQCRWNDCLHLSPIHPGKIKAALENAGGTWHSSQFFVTPDTTLDRKNITTIVEGENDFQDFSPETLARHQDVPEKTKQYFRETLEVGKKPLLYAHTAHVLYRGEIDTKDLEIISV